MVRRGEIRKLALARRLSNHTFVEPSAYVMAVSPTASWFEYLDFADAVLTERLLPIDGEVLYEEVYRREVEQFGKLAEQLKEEPDRVDALSRWLSSNAEFVATKKSMSAALALAAQASPELRSYSFDRLTKARWLLDRAVAADEIRSDVSPKNLIRYA